MSVRWTVVSAVAFALLFVAACDNRGSPSPDSTASPPSDGGAPMLDWRRIPDDDRSLFGGEGQQRMLGVTDLDGLIVAVGYDSSGDEDLDAAIWMSSDGTTWTRIPHDEALFGGDGNQIINSVTAYGGAFVAVGYDHATGDDDAAVWRSADGINWSRVGTESELGGAGDQRMDAITAIGGRLIAAGYTGEGGSLDAAVWTSDDGGAWTRVRNNALVADGNQQILDLTASPSDGLVAVGYTKTGEDRNGAIWRSGDGLNWERLEIESVTSAGDQNLVSVAAGEDAFVAAGFDENSGETVSIWRSEDGVAWEQVGGRPFSGHHVQSMNGLNATPYGFIALGCDLADGREDAGLWFSDDGIEWAKQLDVDHVLGGDGGQYIEALKLTGGLLVAVGYVSEHEDIDGATWVAHIPPEMVPAGRLSSSP